MALVESPDVAKSHYSDPELRRQIFERDRWSCQYCGEALTGEDATLDHIIPTSAGGTDDPANLATACLICNSIKSGRTLEEAAPQILAAVNGALPRHSHRCSAEVGRERHGNRGDSQAVPFGNPAPSSAPSAQSFGVRMRAPWGTVLRANVRSDQFTWGDAFHRSLLECCVCLGVRGQSSPAAAPWVQRRIRCCRYQEK